MVHFTFQGILINVSMIYTPISERDTNPMLEKFPFIKSLINIPMIYVPISEGDTNPMIENFSFIESLIKVSIRHFDVTRNWDINPVLEHFTFNEILINIPMICISMRHFDQVTVDGDLNQRSQIQC